MAVVEDRVIQNLRVIDADMMSEVVLGNANAQTVMFADKASGMTREDNLTYVIEPW